GGARAGRRRQLMGDAASASGPGSWTTVGCRLSTSACVLRRITRWDGGGGDGRSATAGRGALGGVAVGAIGGPVGGSAIRAGRGRSPLLVCRGVDPLLELLPDSEQRQTLGYRRYCHPRAHLASLVR